MVSGAAAPTASPRNMLEMHVLGPHPDLPSQALWEWGPSVCVFTGLPGTLMPIKVTALGALKNSDAHSPVQRV